MSFVFDRAGGHNRGVEWLSVFVTKPRARRATEQAIVRIMAAAPCPVVHLRSPGTLGSPPALRRFRPSSSSYYSIKETATLANPNKVEP